MKVSLVIDGNYLLNKDVFILYGMKTLYSDLNTLLWKDMTTLTRMYAYDNIYFVSDSKLRWRKKLYSDYKGNRHPDEKIDWSTVYKLYDVFKEELKEKSNIHMYEVDWLEGDDLISYIVNENNARGISNVIMAADGDIKQMVKFDLGLEYINVMHNYKFSDEVTYWPLKHNIFITEMNKRAGNSLFDMNEDNEFLNFLEELEYKTKTKEVSAEEVLFCKMVSGDKKDNVPSVYHKNNRGIGAIGSLSIYKLYKETNQEIIDFDSDNFINKLTELISYSKKVTDTTVNDSIKENLIRNRKLLKLDEKYLPTDLKENLINKVKIY
jgi:5'-3' exonuclease